MALQLILGSASPRRRELLAQVFPGFTTMTADVDEGQFPDELSSLYHARITMAKLAAVCAKTRAAGAGHALVLAADTIVVVGDRVMGKPLDAEDARRTLSGLAGKEHEVRTRFLVARTEPEAVLHAQTVTTTVWFRALDADEIAAYVASGEPMDKAGAYGIQGGAASFVRAIEGSYTNVVGLPLAEVVTALRPLLRG